MRTQKLKSGEIAVILDVSYEARRDLQINTGCTDPKKAKAVIDACNLDSIEVLARAGKLSATLIRKLTLGGTMTVKQAIDEWSVWLKDSVGSQRTSESSISNVMRWYVDTCPQLLMDVKTADISNWINRKDDLKRGSKLTQLAGLRSFFKFCSSREYISPNPCLDVMVKSKLLTQEQKEPVPRSLYTDKDIQKIMDYLLMLISDLELRTARRKEVSPHMAKQLRWAWFWFCAVPIGRYAGLRLGDIATMEWSSLTKAGTMVVWTEKRDTRVQIPITGKLAEAIACLPPSGKPQCFPDMARLQRSHKRSLLSVNFARVLRACGLGDGYCFHGLRHTLATELNSKGETIEEIAEALGHRNTGTTKGYIH